MLPFSLTVSAAVVKGTVNDEAGEPMPQATVRLLVPKDSSFVKGTKTNLDGRYTISGVKNGKYIIETTFLGYVNSHRNIEVTGQTLNVPAIAMKESSIMLKEVSVTGVKTQIKVAEDTEEYNADSYKTECRGGGPAQASAGSGSGFRWQDNRQRQGGDKNID